MNAVRRVGDLKLVVGAITVAGLFLTSAIIFLGLPQRALQGRGSETVTAAFENTGRLGKGAPVRVHGVDVGNVTGIERAPGGAVVRMRVKKSALPLHSDARASVRWRTVLGGNHYVDLDPGTTTEGRLAGNVVPRPQTDAQIELDEIVSMLRPQVRQGLRGMLRELPIALSDAPATQSAIGSLADSAKRLGEGIEPVRGKIRDADLRALVRNTGRLVDAANDPPDGIRRIISSGAGTFQITARRRSEIAATIERASRVLPEVEQTVEQLDGTLALADPVVRGLQKPAADVAPTLRRLRPTLVNADSLLQRARPLLRDLSPSVRSLARFADQGRPLLEELIPALARLDEQILPDLAKVNPATERPTFQMVGPTVAGLNALASGFDGTSHLANLAPQIGQSNIDSLPCKTYFADPTAEQLVACEGFKHVVGQILSPPAKTNRKVRGK